MRIELMDKGQMYWLVSYSCHLNNIDGESEGMLNIITFGDTQTVLRCKGIEAVSYFIRDTEIQEELSLNIVTKVMLNAQKEDPEVYTVIREHVDVFKDQVPDELSSDRGLVHEINTGDETSTNIQAYQLSSCQINEQTQQITDMLSKGLMRESSSA